MLIMSDAGESRIAIAARWLILVVGGLVAAGSLAALLYGASRDPDFWLYVKSSG